MIIGITGKSGSGKSTLARKIMEIKNNSIYLEMDKVGHNALTNPKVIEEVIKTFGKEVIKDDKVDRKKLGEIVFDNKEEMDKLTEITWEYMKVDIKNVVEYIDNITKWASGFNADDNLPEERIRQLAELKIMLKSFDTALKTQNDTMSYSDIEKYIEYKDSLSTDNTDSDCYTLCLANPPFAGSIDKEVIAKSLTAIASTKKTELLFVALFTRMLELGGRCASIVPDGVLFGTSAGHKAIRRELVDHQRLQAVISMPSGVFKPYAGVSTAILIFTKTNSGGTDKVWFYDMRADGFSLDDKRNPVSENDIPDIIHRYEHLDEEETRSRKEQSFFVPADEIRQNDYDLSINKYKEVERERIEYEPVTDIMARLEQTEQEYQKGFVELSEMLNQ